MKTSLLLTLFIHSFGLFGEIRNGYENRIRSARESLQKLYAQLLDDNNLPFMQRQKARFSIKKLTEFIAYYELTQELIDQLKMVSPGIYNEMNGIKDKRGRLTDIFIKLVPKEQSKVPLSAASYFAQATVDEDAHLSEYGEYSVSVEICIVNNSLQLLCHELGHIKYVVPNLASYSKFYKRHYIQPIDFSCIGHIQNDQSGKLAEVFESKFIKDRAQYLRQSGEKLESAVSILQKIKKCQEFRGLLLPHSLRPQRAHRVPHGGAQRLPGNCAYGNQHN